VQAYSISSPLSAFLAFAVFASQAEASIDDPYRQETLNWWMGFTLLIAVGTLTYITLMHILPEVYLGSDHEDHDHLSSGNNDEEEKMRLLDQPDEESKQSRLEDKKKQIKHSLLYNDKEGD